MSSVDRVKDVVSGGENLQTATLEQLAEATAVLETATTELKAADGDRKEQFAKARDEAATKLTEIQAQVNSANDAAEAARDAEIDKMLAEAKNTREPSKAWAFAGAPGGNLSYQSGDFIWHVYRAKSDDDFSIEDRMESQAWLKDHGAAYHQSPGISIGGIQAKGGFDAKATLGTSAAAGGLLIPGATVGDIIKPPIAATAVGDLVRTIQINSYQNLIPVRVTAPTRAAVVAWGVTKTNVDLTYGSYTATTYTLAIIYDVAKQLLRYSGGSVEADLRGELNTSFRLGKAYYILQGSGTNEPYGIQTAIATAFSAYTSSFSPVGTTLAGSVAKAIATAAGGLQVRNFVPEAALLGVAAYWDMVSQGTDSAGFFFAPAGGPTAIRPGTLLAPWGIPVYAETQLAGTDDLLVGQFSALQVFEGESFRVDTSDEAGERWDKNLVGFRGETELGLDARAAVFAGAFQFIADVTP